MRLLSWDESFISKFSDYLCGTYPVDDLVGQSAGYFTMSALMWGINGSSVFNPTLKANITVFHIALSGEGFKTQILNEIRTMLHSLHNPLNPAMPLNTQFEIPPNHSEFELTAYVAGMSRGKNGYIATGVQHNNGYILRDEATKLFAEIKNRTMSSGLQELYSTIHDGMIEGKLFKDLHVDTTTVYIPMYLAASTEVYMKFTPEFFMQGLGNRMFFVVSHILDSLQKTYYTNVHLKRQLAYRATVQTLLDKVTLPRLLAFQTAEFTEEATTAYLAFYDRNFEFKTKEFDALWRVYRNRLTHHLLKLSMISAAACLSAKDDDTSVLLIEKEDVDRAETMMYRYMKSYVQVHEEWQNYVLERKNVEKRSGLLSYSQVAETYEKLKKMYSEEVLSTYFVPLDKLCQRDLKYSGSRASKFIASLRYYGLCADVNWNDVSDAAKVLEYQPDIDARFRPRLFKLDTDKLNVLKVKKEAEHGND